MSQNNKTEMKREKYAVHDVRNAISPFMISMIFVAIYALLVTGAVMTTFLTKYLHTTDEEFAIIMSGVYIGIIGTIIGTYMVARSGITKPYLIFGTVIGRSMYIILAIVILIFPYSFAGQHNFSFIYITMAIIIASFIFNNFGAAGWSTWMADLIPRSIAGRLFGTRAQLAFFLQLIIGISAPFIIEMFHHSRYIYATVFAFGGICGILDIVIHSKIREVKREVPVPFPTVLEMFIIPWKDNFFKKIAPYLFVSNIGFAFMGVFAWRYCYQESSVNGLGVGFNIANMIIVVIPLLCMLVAAPIWGKSIDIFGAKITLLTALLAHSIMPLCWVVLNVNLFDKTVIIIVLCFVAVLTGCTWPGIEQSVVYTQMKLFPNRLKVAFITSSALCASLGGLLGTLLAGKIADSFSIILPETSFFAWMSEYQLLFLLAAILRAIAYFYLKHIVTFPTVPTQKATVQTIYKYVFTNIGNSITYLFRPLTQLKLK